MKPRSGAAFAWLRVGAVLIALASASVHGAEATPDRAKNLVVLDSIGVENLKIETQEASDQPFEQVFFAGGRVETTPNARAIVSSLKAGRVAKISVAPGDWVEAGAEMVQIEEAGADAKVPLTAPIAGLVLSVQVSQGESFRRAKTLIEIANLRDVDVVARVPEHEASLISVGSFARIRVLAACDKIFKGTLVRFGTEGDRKHGTVEAYYRLPNRDLLMRPGMRAEFRIIAAERKTTAVPRDAVQGNAVEQFVFVKDHELPNAFLRVPIVVGQRNDRFAEIVRGLSRGDAVVTRGAYALSSAGQGSVSLREALDAAHGHAHSEDGKPIDGSEPHQAHDGHEGHDGHDGHDQEPAGEHARTLAPATLFFASLSVLLLGLLWLSRRHPPVARA